MNSTVGATITSKLPVSWPSENHAAVSSGRCSTSMPIFRHSPIKKTAKSWYGSFTLRFFSTILKPFG